MWRMNLCDALQDDVNVAGSSALTVPVMDFRWSETVYRSTTCNCVVCGVRKLSARPRKGLKLTLSGHQACCLKRADVVVVVRCEGKIGGSAVANVAARPAGVESVSDLILGALSMAVLSYFSGSGWIYF